MVKSSMKLVLQVLKAMITNWYPNWLNSSNFVHASKFVLMTISVIIIGCVCTKIDTCVMSIGYITFLIMYCVCALEPCTASCIWWWYWYQLIDRALRLSILGKRVGKSKRVILGIKLCRWLHHGSWFANHWAMDWSLHACIMVWLQRGCCEELCTFEHSSAWGCPYVALALVCMFE